MQVRKKSFSVQKKMCFFHSDIILSSYTNTVFDSKLLLDFLPIFVYYRAGVAKGPPSNLFLRPLDLFLFEKIIAKNQINTKIVKNVWFFSH